MSNGWFRLTAASTVVNTNNYTTVNIGSTGANATSPWVGTGSEYLYIYGVQDEYTAAQSFVTSYIPTVASAVTRAADVATLNGAALSLMLGAAGSAIASTGPIPAVTTNNPVIVGSDVNGGGGHLLYPNAANNTTLSTYGGTAVLSATLGNSSNWSSNAISAVAWSAAGRSLVANGGTVVTDANGFAPSALAIKLGCRGNDTTQINSWMRSFVIYSYRMPDAKLQLITKG